MIANGISQWNIFNLFTHLLEIYLWKTYMTSVVSSKITFEAAGVLKNGGMKKTVR